MSQVAILTGLSAFPDSQFLSLKNPTIFQIAKANAYKTILIDLQGATPNGVIRRNDTEKYLDELKVDWSEFSPNNPMMADIAAAEYLRKRFINEKGLFVILCKRGVHVLYESSYPGEDKKYQHYLPKLARGETHSLNKRERIINYKNAIRFNIDGFFSALFGDVPDEIQNTTILWTSDHGQSLQEDGQLEPHNSGYLEQAFVPFLIFSTTPWVLENIKRPENISATISHLNIYPSLRSIFEREQNIKQGEFLSLFWQNKWQNPKLFYASGGLWHEDVHFPSVLNGRVIMRSDKYIY